MMKNFLIALASTGALLGHGAIHAQTLKTDYKAIVGSGGAEIGFNAIQKPATLQTANFGTGYELKRLDYEVPSDYSGRLKFFLPPGTIAFNASLFYFVAAQEGKVALRFNQPPIISLGAVTAANAGGPIDETVLRNLVAGKEVLYYSASSPPNAVTLSSPNNAIDPISPGGYVYGNFQYPGGILQRGLLQIFVKADCYEKWFNSTSTQWDAKGNPDENATHTCDGASNPNEPGEPNEPEEPTDPDKLKGVRLSPSNVLQVGGEPLSLTPIPATATLPQCILRGQEPVILLNNKISLKPTTKVGTYTQKLECGDLSTEVVIQVDDGSNPTVPAKVEAIPVTDSAGNLLLDVTLTRPEADVEGKANTKVWIAARIPVDGVFFTNDEWWFLTQQSWMPLLFGTADTVAYQTFAQPSAETKLTGVPIGIRADELSQHKVEIHFGYQDEGGIFQNKGKIWPKN